MKQILTVALTLVVAGTLVVAQNARDPQVLFKAAQHTEEVQGDLKAAIAQYQQVVAAGNRALAAQALLRMAACYEKLGDESRPIYERVVRDYEDQVDSAAMARKRLVHADPAGNSTSMASRVRLTLPRQGDLSGSAMSRDGRFVTYTDWATGGDLVLHELANGRDRRLTDQTRRQGMAEAASISRDGQQVAYSWYDGAKNNIELRVASLAGAGVPESRLVYDNHDVGSMYPLDWSPDGAWIAVQLTRADNTGQMGLVSVRDGSLRVLKSSAWLGARQLFFSPDGKHVGFDLPAGDTRNDQRDVFLLAVDGSREAPAAVGPSDETMMGWSPDGTHLLFASDRSGTVALWAVLVTSGRPQGSPVLIKPDIARRSLGVTTSGSLYFGVHAGDRDIRVASVNLETGALVSPPGTFVQRFVGFNDSPSWSPDGNQLAYLSRRDPLGRGRVLGIQSVDTGQVREWQPKSLNIFQPPSWAPDGRSVLVWGLDVKGRRDAFRIDAHTGGTTPIGATAGTVPQWSPDGRKLYSSKHIKGNLKFFAEWDLASGTEREVIRRENMGPPFLSPDGRTIAAIVDESQTSSVLFLIPVAGGAPRALLRVSRPEALDRRHVAWTPDGGAALVHVLDKGGEQGALVLVPVDGGQSRKIDLGTRVWGGFGFDVHPDGRQIAFVAGENKAEVWVLDNFLPALNAKTSGGNRQ